jgi:hypothetical protein
VIVGVDDTDVVGSPGTGRLVRLLAAELEAAGIGAGGGVTRHQLFEGSGVPKTSRNSAAALALTGADHSLVESAAFAFLRRHHAPGSDPGLAVLGDPPGPDAVAFGRRVQAEVVSVEEAMRAGDVAGIRLHRVAGGMEGMIGALAAAVLRADGNDGRYVGLRGIRELPEVATVAGVLTRSAIEAVIDGRSRAELAASEVLHLGSWVRPRLVDGRPVLVATRSERGSWRNADARPART